MVSELLEHKTRLGFLGFIGLDKQVHRDAMAPQEVGAAAEERRLELMFPCSTRATSAQVAVAVAQVDAKDSVVRVANPVVGRLESISHTMDSIFKTSMPFQF